MIKLPRLFKTVKKEKVPTLVEWSTPSNGVFESTKGIHIWSVKSEDFAWQDYQDLLTEKEFNHILKYKNPKDRHKRAISRGILKELSASYLRTAPKDLNYDTNRFGKPFIANSNHLLQFNISHSTDYILLAFSFDPSPIGIDIEENNLDFNFLDIADQYFSDHEKDSLCCTNPSEQFFKIWTRKEAMMKAIGEGLTDELVQIDVLKDLIHLENYQGQNCHLKTFTFENKHLFSVAKSTPFEEVRFFDYR